MGIFIKSCILHALKFHLHTLSCHFWLNLCPLSTHSIRPQDIPYPHTVSGLRTSLTHTQYQAPGHPLPTRSIRLQDIPYPHTVLDPGHPLPTHSIKPQDIPYSHTVSGPRASLTYTHNHWSPRASLTHTQYESPAHPLPTHSIRPQGIPFNEACQVAAIAWATISIPCHVAGLCNSFKDRAPKWWNLYRCPKFKWVKMDWPKFRALRW